MFASRTRSNTSTRLLAALPPEKTTIPVRVEDAEFGVTGRLAGDEVPGVDGGSCKTLGGAVLRAIYIVDDEVNEMDCCCMSARANWLMSKGLYRVDGDVIFTGQVASSIKPSLPPNLISAISAVESPRKGHICT